MVQGADSETALRGKSGEKNPFINRFNKLSLCNHDKEATHIDHILQIQDVLSYKLFGLHFISSKCQVTSFPTGLSLCRDDVSNMYFSSSLRNHTALKVLQSGLGVVFGFKLP